MATAPTGRRRDDELQMPAVQETVADAHSLAGRSGLRVALFSGNYNYTRDGANLTLNRLVAFLERRNIAVRIYAPTVEQPAFAATGTLISVPSMALPRRPEYRLGLGLPRKVVADLAAFQPTLFHLSAPDLIGYRALALGRRWRLPVVASYHTRFEAYLGYYGLSFLRPAVVRYLRQLYSRCDQLYAPTASLADALRAERFNRDVRVWSRGIDRARFSPAKRDTSWRDSLGIGSQDVVVTFVGRLVLEKGLNLLVDVMNRLAATGVAHRVLIVGDGPERTFLQQRLPTAILTGHLEGAALERAYASSDIFFNPSTTESFGNVTLEAMASGLAAVCARATGSDTLVRHGVTGFLIDPERPADFASSLARLAADATLRRSMGEAGRVVSAGFDWDRVMEGLVVHYFDAHAAHATAGRAHASARPARFAPVLVAQEQP